VPPELALDQLSYCLRWGSTTTLLITDQAAAEVRPTYDADAIAEITSYAAYVDFSERLRKLGFTEDTTEGAPICRWRQKQTILDLLPLDERILGFSNRWYKSAMEFAQDHQIGPGLRIGAVTAVYFCATKLEAFRGRGKGDYLSSHDLEDLVSVVDGRLELVDEMQVAPKEVRTYIAFEVKKLLDFRSFVDVLPGYLLPDAANQARITTLIGTLEADLCTLVQAAKRWLPIGNFPCCCASAWSKKIGVGHAGKDMSDLCDKIREDILFPESGQCGFAFELPCVIPKVPNCTENCQAVLAA